MSYQNEIWSNMTNIVCHMFVCHMFVCCMTNISNMFLAECWRLETSCRLFYDFIKTTIQQDLASLNGLHIPFLIVLYSPFQINETLKSWHIWLLSYSGGLLN